jgi:uncharacterized protein
MTGQLTPELLRAILGHYRMRWFGRHGVAHWARVLELGLRLAKNTGARVDVVELFAVFHDSQRVNDGRDHGHGRRGAQLAVQLRGTAFQIDDAGFDLLVDACNRHTDGQTEADVTVQTCWDADRLDLRRAGIIPQARYLCTAPAKDDALIAWASDRSLRDVLPDLVERDWGLRRDEPA